MQYFSSAIAYLTRIIGKLSEYFGEVNPRKQIPNCLSSNLSTSFLNLNIFLLTNLEDFGAFILLFRKDLNTLVIYKSVNLQYITLVCWDDGPNESSTKHLMFQVKSDAKKRIHICYCIQ